MLYLRYLIIICVHEAMKKKKDNSPPQDLLSSNSQSATLLQVAHQPWRRQHFCHTCLERPETKAGVIAVPGANHDCYDGMIALTTRFITLTLQSHVTIEDHLA